MAELHDRGRRRDVIAVASTYDANVAIRSAVMDFLIKHFNEMREIDASTIQLICLNCALAKAAIRNSLPNPAVVFLMYPFTILFAITAYYVFLKLELVDTNQSDQWLLFSVIATAVGCLITILATAWISGLGAREKAPSETIGR